MGGTRNQRKKAQNRRQANEIAALTREAARLSRR
jgi:hypothetical protein